MNWTLLVLGEGGMRIAESVLFSCMAGRMPAGSVRVLTVSCSSDTHLKKQVEKYRRVHAMMSDSGHPCFSPEISLEAWPLPTEPVTLAEQITCEEDRLLCRALFSPDRATAILPQSMGGFGATAAICWTQLLRELTAEKLTELVGDTSHMMLCGSLCDAVCAAGVDRLTAWLRQLRPGLPVSAVLLGPVNAQDPAGLARETLSGMDPEHIFTGFSLISLPEDCLDARKSGAHLCHWFAAVAVENILRTGSCQLGFRVRAARLTWEDFGADAPEIRAAWLSLFRTGWLLEMEYGDTIQDNLTSPNWLRDRLIGWYAAFFQEARNLSATQREDMIGDLTALRSLFHDLCVWIDSIQISLPAAMQWSKELQHAKGISADHYAALLDVAAQLALLRHEAKKSGMDQEHFIHRYHMQETEAETIMRQIQELEEKLTTLEEEQNRLDLAIGGRLKRNMLWRFVTLCREEADNIATQAAEARKVIDHAAEIATVEEMPKVDAARSRLERMERHLAVLQGRAARAKADAEKAEAPSVRLLTPGITGERGEGLFPSAGLNLLTNTDLARKERKRQLNAAWPWEAPSVKALTDLIAAKKSGSETSSPLGLFLLTILRCTAETEENA